MEAFEEFFNLEFKYENTKSDSWTHIEKDQLARLKIVIMKP